MARLVFAPRALQDIERLTKFLMESEPGAAGSTAKLLFDGLRILKNHPPHWPGQQSAATVSCSSRAGAAGMWRYTNMTWNGILRLFSLFDISGKVVLATDAKPQQQTPG